LARMDNTNASDLVWRGTIQRRTPWRFRFRWGRIILKCILKKWGRRTWAGFIWRTIGIHKGLLSTQ